MAEGQSETLSPFEILGGVPSVNALVARFYDLMENDTRFADLRVIHAPDLGPTRASLAGFLSAWLGGPRDWFEQRPGSCIMSAHRKLGFGEMETAQWLEAMAQALDDVGAPTDLAEKMNEAFARMGGAMQSS